MFKRSTDKRSYSKNTSVKYSINFVFNLRTKRKIFRTISASLKRFELSTIFEGINNVYICCVIKQIRVPGVKIHNRRRKKLKNGEENISVDEEVITRAIILSPQLRLRDNRLLSHIQVSPLTQ